MHTGLDEVARVIRSFIASEAHVQEGDPQFTPDVHLFDAGYLDSIRLVTLMAFLESTFDVKLDESALFSEGFTTIRGIAALVRAAQGRAAKVPEKPPEPERDLAIRPLTVADLPAVASLYEFIERSGTRQPPPPGLAGYFRRLLFDQPHADPEVPSLVYEENGTIHGFLGVHTRRFRFRGRPVRVAYNGPFIVDPSSRHKAVGLHLLREGLAGPQDLTLTDGGTHDVQSMWAALGGQARPIGNVRWTRIFRPCAFATETLLRRAGAAGRLLKPLRVLGWPLQAVADLVARWSLEGTRFRAPEPRPPLREVELTPEALVERIESPSPFSLVPAYDPGYVRWLFFELGEVRSRGHLRRVLLVEPGGSVAGWYVYYLLRGGISQVLQVGATPATVEAVLAHLFHDADRGRSTALQGRVEPALLPALRRADVSLQHTWSYALAYTKDPELAAALHTADSLVTRLDGEWWCGFREPLDRAQPDSPVPG